MILNEFPDIGWLKSQIAQGFSNRLGWGNLPLDKEGFPSVIIHTRVKECYRPDVKGPFSFFLNIRGTSYCGIDSQKTRIDTDNYYVSNRQQLYTLGVEEDLGDTETFNIHFGDFLSESVLNSTGNSGTPDPRRGYRKTIVACPVLQPAAPPRRPL
ncbi:hypothetical protein ACQ86N_18505 [Puia sp. P3]|uniref:hypothetical protein n=1 Tax=Puia sp. P3 TaxID=3423952 RepID=UPI003D669B02